MRCRAVAAVLIAFSLHGCGDDGTKFAVAACDRLSTGVAHLRQESAGSPFLYAEGDFKKAAEFAAQAKDANKRWTKLAEAMTAASDLAAKGATEPGLTREEADRGDAAIKAAQAECRIARGRP